MMVLRIASGEPAQTRGWVRGSVQTLKGQELTIFRGIYNDVNVVHTLAGDEELTATGKGDGGYDAFMKATRKALKRRGIKIPALLDYAVHIPPGGMSDALVETTIKWENNGRNPLITIGVSSDQIVAAIEATEKMLNVVVPPQLQK